LHTYDAVFAQNETAVFPTRMPWRETAVLLKLRAN
jgi:hypothetical protein